MKPRSIPHGVILLILAVLLAGCGSSELAGGQAAVGGQPAAPDRITLPPVDAASLTPITAANASSLRQISATPQPIGWIAALSFAPQASVLFVDTNGGDSWMWLLDEGRIDPIPITGVFSPDGTRLGWGTFQSAGWVSVGPNLQMSTRDEVSLPHEDWVNSIAWSPDGARLATGTGGTAQRRFGVWVWDVAAQQPLAQVDAQNIVKQVAFSPDGASVAYGTSRGDVAVIDAATGNERLRISAHTDSINGLAYSADGARIVSASADRSLRAWDAVTGAPVYAVENAHEEAIQMMALSPDGALLATAGDDGVVRLWDAAAGDPLAALSPTPAGDQRPRQTAVSFNAAGTLLATGGEDGMVYLWAAGDSGEQ